MAVKVVNTNTAMGASGANHAPGVVPDPGASSGTTKFLREDATWDVPPGSGSGVSSLDGITGAVTLVAGSNITITDNSPSAGDITIAATGGGGSALTGFITLDWHGASSGTEFGDVTITGVGSTWGAIAGCPPISGSGSATMFTQGFISAFVTATNTVHVIVTIPSGGSVSYGSFDFPIMAFDAGI